ncbi:MAG: DUF4382 domain-containing protein [Ferruginibacter sp.]
MKTSFKGITMLATAALLLFFAACQKDVSSTDSIPAGQSKISVYLLDGPADYQQVLVDIRAIDIKIDTCRRHGDDDHDGPGCDDDHDSLSSRCEIWQSININPGVYDLLSLRNGLDTLLASGFIFNGKIERIKLTLGTNNHVLVDSVLYPLRLQNNQNFVYVNIHREHLDSISSSNFNLYLDFDLNRSIRYTGGEYWLKPVLRPFGRHSTGEIEGKIRPVHSFGTIKAWNATDTAFAMPEDEGEFKIRGLRAGTYNVFIDGINGYRDTTLSNIIVRQNEDTRLGTILLRQ